MTVYQFAGRWGPEAVLDPAGNIRVGATVSVKQGATTSTLYTDRTKASTGPNPATVDTFGNVTFFADPGTYDVTIMHLGATVLTTQVTVGLDPDEPGAVWATVPTSASATGITGQKAYAAGFLYICVATNTWQRVAISTW